MKREKIVMLTDSLACQLYNFFSKIKFSINISQQKVLIKNKELINKNDNKVCFILGNGPSLKDVNIQLIKGYPIFTVNYFFKGGIDIEPSYHVMIDSLYCGSEFTYVQNLIHEHQNTKFILPFQIMTNPKYQNISENDKKNMYFIHTGLKTYLEYIQCDMTKQMTVSLNVLPFTIQCAIYMGYREIYILGYEFGLYAPIATGHFYNSTYAVTDPSDVAENLVRGAIVQRHNWALAQYCKKRGIKIMNLTPESYIKAYPMALYEDIVSKLESKT